MRSDRSDSKLPSQTVSGTSVTHTGKQRYEAHPDLRALKEAQEKKFTHHNQRDGVSEK